MILSVSRRTDIPAFYSDWFMGRIREGYLYVKNPMNAHQISQINLSPELVDCIVFWTKNPKPLMKYLPELNDYAYYFQYTITGFGKEVEKNVPSIDESIDTFISLSKQIGKKRVIWRYDPIFISDTYSVEYHEKMFDYIASKLAGYTEKCVISFVDDYGKNHKNLQSLGMHLMKIDTMKELAEKLSSIGKKYSLPLASCAERIDLQKYGIAHNCCIDKELIESITGFQMLGKKDKNQREECGCLESIEVGTYNTCRNDCKYCYATYSIDSVISNTKSYDVNSPLLCGKTDENSKITERKVKSLKDGQMTLWDMLH